MTNKEQLHKNILVLIESGKTKRDISKILNVSEKVVSFIAKQNGISLTREISRGNSELYDMLTSLFPYLYIEREKHLEYGLKIDLYIPSIKLGFEIDGIQHDQYVPFFHKDEDAFYAQAGRDGLKERIASKHGIKIIRYKTLPTMEELNGVVTLQIHSNAQDT